MSDDVRVSLTEKGREAIKDIVNRFAKGESIEEIADSYELAPEAIQILMAIDELEQK